MKIKIILSIAFVSAICLSFVGSARCDATVISINPSSQTLPQSRIGTNYQIDINISDVANLWQWKVRLNWNPSVLNFIRVDEGTFLNSSGSTLFLNASARSGYVPEISDTLLENTSTSGSGLLAIVTFKVLAAGQSDITLNETLLTHPTGQVQIPHTVDNGQLIVVPEFQNWTFLAIALVATIPAAILAKKRFKPTN